MGSGAGNFLSGDDIPEKGVMAVITEEPHMVPSNFPAKDGSRKEQCRILLKFGKNIERLWTMNSTSFNKCVEQFGTKESAWVGKKVFLTRVSALVNGQMRKVVYGEPA